ncbi:MAG: hypothetical protein FWB98_08170, partial [Defluviitaleaceae bacterium]|nr:hypothetical protein [Defluviitaleaceae bacterium]
MQNEKMMILKMLEEGKINAEEASRLLAADGGSAPSHAPSPPLSPRPSGHVPGNQMPPGGSHASHPTSGGATDSVGAKFGAFMKDMEPKLQKAGKFV